MKKLTYIIAFCLGVALTCLCNHISLIKPALAENPSKQKLLNIMALGLVEYCVSPVGIKNECLSFYSYYKELGGNNERIYQAMEVFEKQNPETMKGYKIMFPD